MFIAIIVGVLAYGNLVDRSENNKQEEKKIQINETKPQEVKSSIIVSKTEPKNQEPIKEEIKPEPTKQEPIKEEIKPEPTEQEPIKEEIKPEPTEQEPIKEEIKPELIQEDIKERDSTNETGTSWLRLALYILGPVFFVLIIKYVYTRLRNDPLSKSSSNYFRNKFKEEIQTDNTEQQPAQEEIQTDNTEQQPAQEEDEDNNKK